MAYRSHREGLYHQKEAKVEEEGRPQEAKTGQILHLVWTIMKGRMCDRAKDCNFKKDNVGRKAVCRWTRLGGRRRDAVVSRELCTNRHMQYAAMLLLGDTAMAHHQNTLYECSYM